MADEILASAKGYRTFEEWFAHIEEYRQELKRLAQEKRRNQNAVTFATLHSAKGLEFTKVYLIDVNEGVMPYKKAVLKQDVEEERRFVLCGNDQSKGIPDHLFGKKNAWQRGGTVAFYQRSR